LHRRQCPLRLTKARADLERGARGVVLQPQWAHLQGTRALVPAVEILRTKRAVELLDAVRPRRRRLRRHGGGVVPSPHQTPLEGRGRAAGGESLPPARRRLPPNPSCSAASPSTARL